MILFLFFALILTTLALLFVLLPLLRKPVSLQIANSNQANLELFKQQLDELANDLTAGLLEQHQYEAARRDLERDLVLDAHNDVSTKSLKSGRWAIIVLIIFVPLFAMNLYLSVGSYQSIARAAAKPTAAAPDMPSVEAAVDHLAQQMRTHPDDLQGWMLLGRSAIVLGQVQRAVDAYAQALRLAPKTPDVMLSYADALAQMNHGFVGKPMELIEAAIAIDPANSQGLWLIGLAEFQQGATAKAAEHWSKLEAILPPNSELATTLHRFIAQVRQGKIIAPTLP